MCTYVTSTSIDSSAVHVVTHKSYDFPRSPNRKCHFVTENILYVCPLVTLVRYKLFTIIVFPQSSYDAGLIIIICKKEQKMVFYWWTTQFLFQVNKFQNFGEVRNTDLFTLLSLDWSYITLFQNITQESPHQCILQSEFWFIFRILFVSLLNTILKAKWNMSRSNRIYINFKADKKLS